MIAVLVYRGRVGMDRLVVSESDHHAITAERDRCAHILSDAIGGAEKVTARKLLAAVASIKAEPPGNSTAAAEQARCARIVEAAAYHMQGHEAAAYHALAAIRLRQSALG